MRYWRDREITDRLIAGRNYRKERCNRGLPEAVGFHWDTEDNLDDIQSTQ